MPTNRITGTVADSLAAGSAVGFGANLLYDVEVIVSIIAGLLVACSAGLSIYLNWARYKKEQPKEQPPILPDPDPE